MTFLNYALELMVEPDNLLVKVESIIDWLDLSTLLDKKLGTQSKVVAGQEYYNYLSMFKVLLL